MTRSGVCSVVLPLLVVGLSVGCAAVPKGEYRSGLFLHRDPTYSFRIPDGWRRGTPEDIESIGYVRFQLKMVTDARRTQLLQNERRVMGEADSFLVSARGAAIMVMSGANRDEFRVPARGNLTEKEKDVLLSAARKRLENTLKKEEATLESADLVTYGANPAVMMTARVRALVTMRFLLRGLVKKCVNELRRRPSLRS
jgi:hypothetical protein